MKKSKKRTLLLILSILIVVIVLAYLGWSSIINLMMPSDSRPGKISFKVETVSKADLQAIGKELSKTYGRAFNHVQRFQKAGIRHEQETGRQG